MTQEKTSGQEQSANKSKFVAALAKGFVAGFITIGLISVLILLFRN